MTRDAVAPKPLLDSRTLFTQTGANPTDDEEFYRRVFKVSRAEILHNARAKIYPDGAITLLLSSRHVFVPDGYELADKQADKRVVAGGKEGQNLLRAKRRAKAHVSDIARCNDFTQFVTLTLDAEKLDRYDMKEITKKLTTWLQNRVDRKGLKYLLIPEYHKDGAIHFHGLFNDCLPRTESGLLSAPDGGGAKRPADEAERDALLKQGFAPIFNLPDWGYGFTTAIDLYGDRRKAVNYVVKYIGKYGSSKIGGRYYYSGGKLSRPKIRLANVDYISMRDALGGYTFSIEDAELEMTQIEIDNEEQPRLHWLLTELLR
jgi:hypothetical protein